MNNHSIPFTKKPQKNNRGLLDWQLGNLSSNIILENKKLNVKLSRYLITRPNGDVLYDTIGISEPKGNSVVVIKNTKGELGLIYEWRPIPEKWFWACVRGFGDPKDNGALDTAKREMIEEIGNCQIVSEKGLGGIYQNTTFYENPVQVVLLIVKDFDGKVSEDEGIKKMEFFSKQAISNMIKNEEIEDTFTLSALAKFLATENSL